MSSGQRERADAAVAHLQQAASEMIAAAHDVLDMLDDAVTTTDLGDVLDTVGHLSRSLLKSRVKSPPRPEPGADGDGARPSGPVQRISVL